MSNFDVEAEQPSRIVAYDAKGEVLSDYLSSGHVPVRQLVGNAFHIKGAETVRVLGLTTGEPLYTVAVVTL